MKLELQINRSFNPVLSGASLVISLLFYFYKYFSQCQENGFEREA